MVEALELALRAARLTDGDVDPTLGRALPLAGYDRDWQELPRPLDNARDSGGEDPARGRGLAGRPPALAAPALGPRAGAARTGGRARSTGPARRCASRRARRWTWAPRPKRGPPIAPPTPLRARPAAACSSASAATSRLRPSPRAAGRYGHRRPPQRRLGARADGLDPPGGLATSSTAVRRWATAAGQMHHIIDPATGGPVAGTWRTVSVAAASCADANIASDRRLVRPAAARATGWSELGLPARLVDRDGRGAASALARRSP